MADEADEALDPVAILGIDLSVYQRARKDGSALPFDPEKVAAAGYAFAFVRLGHGLSVDPWGKDSIEKLQSVGVKCGPYWYLESAHPAAQQRAAYLGTLDGVEPDIAPALDVEEGGPGTADGAILVLGGLVTSLGLPFLYTMPGEAAHAHFVASPTIAEVSRLWQATWTTQKQPMACHPWSGYAVWQFDNAGGVPGIATKVDLNRSFVSLW